MDTTRKKWQKLILRKGKDKKTIFFQTLPFYDIIYQKRKVKIKITNLNKIKTLSIMYTCKTFI